MGSSDAAVRLGVVTSQVQRKLPQEPEGCEGSLPRCEARLRQIGHSLAPVAPLGT